MEKIASFQIDHTKLKRGVYVSRKDHVGPFVVTTFDIRMKVPNLEPALDSKVIHTIEHLAATFLRNDEQWKDKILYWGPMGCLTGNYLLVSGDYNSLDILPVLKRMFRFIADFEGDIPGASAVECGNYLWNDLNGAKREAKIYLEEVLEGDTPTLYESQKTEVNDEERASLCKKHTIRLTTCLNNYDAYMLKDALANEGIECGFGNENMSNIFGGIISAFSGVDVFVFEDDLEKAQNVYVKLYGENNR